MLAVDTNVVVRFLVDDEPAQHRRAVAMLSGHVVWLSRTVLLETEWVLRGAFGFEPGEIAAALRQLTRLSGVRCEDAAAVDAAIGALEAGMDFADALHFAASASADEGFATFDARFVRRARKHWPGAKLVTP
ncbi:type II toxin-antitoxin system VapC family toxin [Xylophilus sp.]|uniref:type II toxin-antitoxin system VapC family toxin n=1 Tax=Xylophilus sp. TaxID=2653893 RepID=UPI0013BC3B8F|nr:type II toxin-antitoxin system VapC family toxin [Xylophilus sp.]KAF1049479.1 MAG: tRNA(fMet)-specific endonuclease VapC [Xylophilus sp.]